MRSLYKAKYYLPRQPLVWFGFVLIMVCSTNLWAARSYVSVAKQYGLTFLPLMIMEHNKYIEQEAKKAGLGNIEVKWATLGGGAAVNDALLSGAVDFVSGSIVPLLTFWSRAHGVMDVRGVASLNAMPWILTSNDPNVKSIKDFTAKDKIAMPAAKVSIQAITLQMAAAKVFGEKRYDQLDKYTVTLKNPDAYVALLSGHSEITAHFSGPPWPQLELLNPKIHEVLSSQDVLGGPGMLSGLYTTNKFRKENHKLYLTVFHALEDAQHWINENKHSAAQVYVEMTKSKLPVDSVYKIIADPLTEYGLIPRNTMKFAEFLHKTGQLKRMPSSWKDLFFPEIYNLPGS